MTAPGWYNDEQDPRFARWHDGTGWTEHTMAKDAWPGPGSPPPPAGLVPPAPVAPAAPAPEPARPVPLMEARPMPERSRRSSRSRRERPSGHLIVAIASLVTILVCLIALQRIDEDRDADAAASRTTTTTVLPAFEASWTTQDGGSYRVVATPMLDTIDRPSPSGCLAAPAAGRTNVAFRVVVENTSITQEAPVPQLAFGVNLGGDGAVDPGIVTLDGASTDVEIGPVAEGASCSLARALAAGQGDPLAPMGVRAFEGYVGGVPSPLPSGLSLIVRYFPADADRRGPGFVNADLVAPFPVSAADAAEPAG